MYGILSLGTSLCLIAASYPPSARAETATLTITVAPVRRDWPTAPVRVAVDSILRAHGWRNPVTSDNIAVREAGQRAKSVSHRPAWSGEGEQEGTILFSKTGAGRKAFEITVSSERRGGEMRTVPVVGFGEPMSYGRTGIVATIDGSFNSRLAVTDWDGDGDTDFLIGQGIGGGATWVMHGLHYYENVGGRTEPLMAKPVWLHHRDGMPHVVDWDADGLNDVIAGTTLLRNNGPRGKLSFRPDTVALAGVLGISHIADWDGDGLFDILEAVSIGGGDPSPSTWLKDIPGSPYTSEGVWRGYDGHGRLMVHRNTGALGSPGFSTPPETLRVGNDYLDVVTGGNPTTGDIDGDGDLDLLVGNRFDLYFFENVGTQEKPRLNRGVPLDRGLQDIYIRPCLADMNGDGKLDILISEECGDVRWMENRGEGTGGLPAFGPVTAIRQRDPFIDIGSGSEFDLKDLDGDGKPDIIGGNSYGEVWQWLSVTDAPVWTFGPGKRVAAGGELIRIFAGASGSIQGPGEARYGYVSPEIADWDQDGEWDLILTDVWGKNRLYRGRSHSSDGPVFAAEELLRFADSADAKKPVWNWWDPEGGELVTQWRTKAEVLDWDGDGVTDYVAIDHEGILALFPGVQTRAGKRLGAPRRVFLDEAGRPLVLNDGANGRSGRHKVNFADWDGDGDLDLIRSVAEPAGNRIVTPEHERGCAFLWENVGRGRFAFRGEMVPDPNVRLAGHATTPLPYDFDGDGVLDLLIGAEDGHIYAFHRAYLVQDLPRVRVDDVRIH